ncbi:rab proteins geranylgeranyltransferase component A [Coccinella septempunctata]|uniref:rab proteins geranylgeranyltransferase component A n=1 Tax=Coccinella septempunctata TaxID=41139 RepID=UPI001D066472|nr:rab proteins geranylgeranyltransferase component A [Coccinella septempunctata]
MDNNLPTEFDIIVVGTGVVESIVSAAASRNGKRVLHLDNKSYYGGHWASFNLEDFQNIGTDDTLPTQTNTYQSFGKAGELFQAFGNDLRNIRNFQTNWHIEKNLPNISDASSSEAPQEKKEERKETNDETETNPDDKSAGDLGEVLGGICEETEKLQVTVQEQNIVTQASLKKDYRKFIIDLCPKLHFARGDFVELLISSNIARYSEFRSVSRVLTWINGNIEVVPCSRSDVFANNKVSVVEKRMLMKLLTSIEEDEKNLVLPAETTYKSLLKSKKLSDNIIHFVLYALSMSTDETSWLDGIRGTKRFLQSLGRFGRTPFLFSMYGSGEITQAFCRLSAVFGGIFALNQPLHGFFTNSENLFQSLICGEQRISAPYLVMNMGMVPSQFLEKTEVRMISRAVFITDKSLMDSEREHLTLLLYPLKNKKLCRVLELGTLTGTCPKNLFLVHLTAVGISSPEEDLQECRDSLFTFENDSTNKCGNPRILWSCYFSIPDTNDQKFESSLPKNIFVCPGPDTDLDYDSSVKKAREIFSSIYPGEVFLPRAPDAEEIVIEEEPEAASEAEVSGNDSKEEEGEVEQTKEETEYTEFAVEAKPSTSEVDAIKDEKNNEGIEECSEVQEITQ